MPHQPQWPALERAAYRPLLTLEDVASSLPGQPHVGTVRRWYREGLRGIRLPITRIGGRVYVEPGQFAVWQEAVGRKRGDVLTVEAA